MLKDPYPVQPWARPCSGEVSPPGSKSLTNRAMVIAALAKGSVRLKGALFSRDTRIMTKVLQQLGFRISVDEEEKWIEIEGLGGRIPEAEATLHVGNAGTAARFLTAFVCLHPGGRYHFDGDEEMRARPMGGLLSALEELGARFVFHGQQGCFPFEVHTCGLRGGGWTVDASLSSQMLSALMMVAPLAREPVRISCPDVRPAFVEMTAGIMGQWGSGINGSPDSGYGISGKRGYTAPGSGEYDIEPDATAASYFMILPAVVGGSVTIRGLSQDMLQGDRAFVTVLEELGLIVEQGTGGCTITSAPIRGTSPRTFDFRTFSDTFLTLAAVAPLLPFSVTIKGIGHTRLQETDRIRAMATELQRVGARVEEGESSITIHPFGGDRCPGSTPVRVLTYKDHRVAMSFAILGCSPRFGDVPWIHLDDPACCGKTFPGFFGVLEDLYRNSHDK
ncbi:MAG: 3-phosphoshikimate 1-carboxyvinyltransferase [Opitutales bacterium]|jgi:3-phosphoshikimate 1-carboxyvinyltransferase